MIELSVAFSGFARIYVDGHMVAIYYSTTYLLTYLEDSFRSCFFAIYPFVWLVIYVCV